MLIDISHFERETVDTMINTVILPKKNLKKTDTLFNEWETMALLHVL